MYNVLGKECSFYELVTAWIENPNNTNLTQQLFSAYSNDEKYKNLDIASMICYRSTLNEQSYLEIYAEFLNKFKILDSYNTSIYLKIIYAHLVLDKYWDGYVLPELKKDLTKFKISCNSVYIPINPPIKSTNKSETQKESEIPKEQVYIIPGFEKRWRSKAIKNREKAEKLTEKYERIKAEKILLKNIEKYGDTKSIEQLAFLYERRALPKLALKYFEMAKNYGFKESAKKYEELAKKYNNNSIIEKCNEYIDLANQNIGTKKELDYLLKVFDISSNWDNISFRIAKILLTPGTNCSDIKLGEKFLIYHLSKIAIIEKYDKHDEFFAYFAKLLLNGTIIKKDKRLAYFCYTCVRNPSNELKTLFEDHINNELKSTFKTLKDKFLSDTKEQKIEYDKEQKEKKEKEELDKLIEEERKSLKNIFNLDPDYKDFQSKSFLEIDKEYEKKLEYYKKALESKEEQTIVSNLEKAGKLYHRKAMVILFYYYMQKQNIDKMYYWFFSALNSLPYLDEIRRIKADVPINLSAILKYFSKNSDDPRCKEFIEDNFDFESDLNQSTIKEFEKYSKNNFFIKTCLNTYYSTHDKFESMIDSLYDLATMDIDYDDKVKYIISYIDQMGGLEAQLNDQFVNFILDPKLDKNKYVMYHRARLYNDEKLCKKYNLIYSKSKVFNILSKANENKTLKVEGLSEKVDMWLGNCYEYGIGTQLDLEKASYLYSPYKNATGSLYLFNHFAIPEIFNLKNFHQIKEKFLQDIKIEDYKSTFETIKKFYNLGFSFDEVFDSDGKYIGDKNYYKVIEKEKEIERKRQEEIRKEQERIRLEKLKKEQEEKERLRIERERQEKLRQEQLKKEKEEQEQLDRLQNLNNKETPTQINTPTTQNNISNTTKPINAQQAILAVRKQYNYPVEPIRPDKDYNDGLTYKQRLRKYGSDYKQMMDIYRQKLRAYYKEEEEYKIRLYKATSQIDNWNIVYEKCADIYNTPQDKLMSYDGFFNECYQAIRNNFGSTSDLESIEVKKEYSDVYYLERTLANLTNYVEEIVLTISIGVYAFEIESYGRRENYSIYDSMEKFENSELAKFMTWSEFSSYNNKIGYEIRERHRYEQLDAYTKGKAYVRTRAWEILLPIFKKNKIIHLTSCLYNGTYFVVPKKMRIIFKFPSLYK